MNPVELIQCQEKLGQKIATLYNSLSALFQSNVNEQERKNEVSKLRESFKIAVAEFNKNDKELRPPSATLEGNSYFKTDFVKKVQETSESFEGLYQQFKNKIMQEGAQQQIASGSKMQTQNFRSQGGDEMKEFARKVEYENKKRFGLKRQFQYILDEVEVKIDNFKCKNITIDVVKEKFSLAEKVFFEYIGEFPDDELTEVFYSLRDSYQEIPDIGKNLKTLPFTVPSIDIPQFDGKVTEWDTFRELFEQLIIAQPISKTQKMCILKSKLGGESIRKIAKLPSREENFDIAWDILNKYYSNNRATTSIYFKSILDAPSVRCNSKSVRNFLFNILLRFRKHRYVFSADIEKMYRQIWVSETDKKYQLIFWRWNPTEEVKTYALKTLTYGTASAPYLAVKCLQKIADWKSNQFPEECVIIKNDFYMDDVMTGGDCLEKVTLLRKNLDNILLEFGMPLRKWCTNDRSIVKGVNEKYIVENLNIKSEISNSIKALGIIWNPNTDELKINCKWETEEAVSKRSILAEISRLFDPLGLVGPIVVSTKILLQELWKLKINWDERVPEEIGNKWKTIRNSFKYLNKITIPRHFIGVKPIQIELHGFCDASMKAYGAAIYIRSIDSNGKIHSYLAASKSRVAPIKIVTLPRLELCASVLLAELMKVVVESLKIKFKNIYFYTDSTIVLSWLRLDPARLQLFVSNRVSFIQANTDIEYWKHVRSEENPADLVSRGLMADQLIQNEFWFKGPKFLQKTEPYFSSFSLEPIIPEQKRGLNVLLIKKVESLYSKINHRNKFNCLQNIIAYVLKFIHLSRKQKSEPFLFYKREALKVILKEIQKEHFKEEIRILKMRKNIPKSSKLTTLCPFLDNEELIRVGGRLENSSLAYEAKHPVVLPYKDNIVRLLIEQLHTEHLHIGPQGLLTITRQRFWPLRDSE